MPPMMNSPLVNARNLIAVGSGLFAHQAPARAAS
jgi:hypothetical protein